MMVLDDTYSSRMGVLKTGVKGKQYIIYSFFCRFGLLLVHGREGECANCGTG
jgi:hypothetical protein